MSPPIHAAARFFPMMPEDELDRLAEDIRRQGLLHPIILHEGAILDGRNRLEACRRAGVEPQFAPWDRKGSPLEWVIAQNVLRRHLTPSQRAVLALQVLPVLEEEANARRRAGAVRSRSAPNGALLQEWPKRPKRRAASEAARLLGASPRYVQRAKRVQQLCPALLPEVAAGRINLEEALRATRLSSGALRLLLEKIAAIPSNQDINLRRLIHRTRESLGDFSGPVFTSSQPAPVAARDNSATQPPAPPRLYQCQVTFTSEQLEALDNGATVRMLLFTRRCLVRSEDAIGHGKERPDDNG